MITIIIFLYIYIIGLLTLCSIRKHIFLCLVRLEFIVLSLFLIIRLYLINYDYEIYICTVFLTFIVCEGAIGLSVLVYLIRSHGNDYLNSIRTILC